MDELVKFLTTYFPIALIAIFLYVIIKWSDRSDYTFPLSGRVMENKRKEYAAVLAFKDFYGTTVNPYRENALSNVDMISLKMACEISELDMQFIDERKNRYFRHIQYEFMKLYRNEDVDIHPIHASQQMEHLYYGSVPPDEWMDKHPETIRYGIKPPYKPEKLTTGYKPPKYGQTHTLRCIHSTSRPRNGNRYDMVPTGRRVDFVIDLESTHPVAGYINWSDIVALMDPEIKRQAHQKIAPCSPRQFLETYLDISNKPLYLPSKTKITVNDELVNIMGPRAHLQILWSK